MYQTWIFSNRRTFLEILDQFTSTRDIPTEDLIYELSKMGLQYRFYSISSSSLKYPKTVAVCVGIANDVTPTGRIHYGVCSTYMKNLHVGDLCQALIRASNFRLPKDPSYPVILAGAGTGIAPLRAMIEERHFQRVILKKNVGPTYLYFGCFHQKEDFLYAEELKWWQHEGTLHLRPAFSHDQEYRSFVQHLILEDAKIIWDLLKNRNAHIYVCG